MFMNSWEEFEILYQKVIADHFIKFHSVLGKLFSSTVQKCFFQVFATHLMFLVSVVIFFWKNPSHLSLVTKLLSWSSQASFWSISVGLRPALWLGLPSLPREESSELFLLWIRWSSRPAALTLLNVFSADPILLVDKPLSSPSQIFKNL